jgi:putative NIF3 family GTP cyclohydrolase 1 type 2
MVGNNAVIARLLDLENIQPFGEYKGIPIGIKGEWKSLSAELVFERLKTKINKDLVIFPYGPDIIRNAGIISGGAQKEVKQAVLQELDLYITGEVSEHTLHYVKEEKIHFVSAGHHATERFGIKALGDHIRKKFNIEVEYVEISNPV